MEQTVRIEDGARSVVGWLTHQVLVVRRFLISALYSVEVTAPTYAETSSPVSAEE